MISEATMTSCQKDDALALRPAEDVMRLSALGASFPHRLSFKRTLIRQLHQQNAKMTVIDNSLDENGYGMMALSIPFHGRIYTLIAYSRALADEDRTDRVIATAWDASFCLFDGVPNADDMANLSDQVTHQEFGKYHEKVMTLSRANKSVRLFAHVVDALAKGQQPDIDQLAKIGYLMRTTAVYGNGKFGIADRDVIKDYDGLNAPFRAEMLTVYLIREFTFQLVNHLARQKGGTDATSLSPALSRHLGVGNSTGLGMAPFLVHHPNLLNSWVMVRETALAMVRQTDNLSYQEQELYITLGQRIADHLRQWRVDDANYQVIIADLIIRWDALCADLPALLKQHRPLDKIMLEAQNQGDDFAALAASFVMEYQGALIDELEECMTEARAPALEPAMVIGDLQKLIERHYRWALAIDLCKPQSRQQFWYVSEEKLEPRLGNAYEEDGQEREMPFAMAFYLADLQKAMADKPADMTVAELLMAHPECRYIIRRIQNNAHFPYAEIQGNLVGEECRPIDLLRFKLSFFGASKFDPRSDRWTRITLFQGAPSADELSDKTADDWSFWVIDGFAGCQS